MTHELTTTATLILPIWGWTRNASIRST